jgi:hypothetical protein
MLGIIILHFSMPHRLTQPMLYMVVRLFDWIRFTFILDSPRKYKRCEIETIKPFTKGVDFYTLSLPKLLICRELYIWHLPEDIFGRSTYFNSLKSMLISDLSQVFSTPLVNDLIVSILRCFIFVANTIIWLSNDFLTIKTFIIINRQSLIQQLNSFKIHPKLPH